MQIVKGIEILGGVEQEPNIYVIDGELIVDCGTGLLFADIKRHIESSYETYKIKNIVNTHGHFDHTGGTKKFRDWLKADVCAHKDDSKMMESGTDNLAEFFNEIPKIVTINRMLRDGNSIKTTNFVFKVVHTPGHTPGSICLYDAEKRLLISGDTIFHETIGRFDLPGGDKDKLLDSLQKLLDFNVQYLLPGHGPPKIGGFSFHVKQMIAHFGEKRFVEYKYY